MTTIVSGSSITFNDNTTQNTSAYGGGFAFRNRIINGDMRIDQRRAGASVSIQNSTGYTLDRWTAVSNQNSKYSVQQDAGAVTPPTGFTDYLGVTSSSAYTVTSGDYMFLAQYIEGYNVADLDFGKSTAKTITISFWVRSSLTGTFGGVIGNGDQNRTYPFSYTISSANTWEQKTITIAGDTTGTWNVTNGTGLAIRFGLGVGSTYLGTAGSWSSSQLFSVTGATNVVATNGATFYITGVQLEKGSTATSFDYRPYGQELANCQRYFETSYDGQAVATSSAGNGTIWWAQATGLYNNQVITFKVRKRANPTTVIYNPNTGATNSIRNTDASTNLAAIVVSDTTDSITGGVNNVNVTQSAGLTFHFSADAEL